MQDIADKDNMIFALNKQLSALRNLLQSQELMGMASPGDMSLVN